MQENWLATGKRRTPGPYLTTYTDINLKWINDLNVRPETINVPEGNIDGELQDTRLGDKRVRETPNAKATRVKQMELPQTKQRLHEVKHAMRKLCMPELPRKPKHELRALLDYLLSHGLTECVQIYDSMCLLWD